MQKVSDFVVRFVAGMGIKHIFLVTGGGAMHLNQSLADCREIQAICNSHEQASAICAEGYAKATNGVGVAMVTTGPGGTNAVTGVAGAWLDSTPTLYISGQVKRPDRMFDTEGNPLGMRQLGVQEVDIVSIVRPITKYAVTVLEPSEICFHMEKAFFLATNGRPGPVWIDIPLDVQASQIEETVLLRHFDATGVLPTLPQVEDRRKRLAGEVSRLIDRFNTAERPLLFAGNGIRLAHAEAEFSQVRKFLDIPTVATWCAADLVPSDEATFVGRPGSVAARGANFALQNCDFLLTIGVRLDFAITGYAPQHLARGAHKAVVDIDPAELRKLSPYLDQPITEDAKTFLSEVLRQKTSMRGKDRGAWTNRCTDWKTLYPVVTEEHRKRSGRVSIFNLAEVLGTECTAEHRHVCGNAGSAIEIYLLACPTPHSQRIYHTAGLGAMGYAIPMAIAVALANPGHDVIAVDGDGGFQFNIQELQTIAYHNLPIKFFVLNNNGYASIRASQLTYFGGASIGCDEGTGLSLPDLSKIASSYGLQSAIIHDQANLRGDIKRILAMKGPVIVDVRVIADEMREPRLSSYQKPDGSFVSRPLEDLFPFLSRDEFMANMIVPALAEQ